MNVANFGDFVRQVQLSVAKAFNDAFIDRISKSSDFADVICQNKYYPAQVCDESDIIAAGLIDRVNEQFPSNKNQALAELLLSARNNSFTGELDVELKTKLENPDKYSGIDKLAVLVGSRPFGYPHELTEFILMKVISKLVGLQPRIPFYEREKIRY